jgi:hypothetical protein
MGSLTLKEKSNQPTNSLGMEIKSMPAIENNEELEEQ